MLKIKEFKKLQEILMNSWPAQHYYFLNGWVLRFTEGVTSRANSVFPINYTGDLNNVDRDIKFVEKAYQTYNLPTIFTIPEYFEPYGLDVKLLEHGYHQAGCITYTMIVSIQELRNKNINDEYSFIFYSERVNKLSTFLAKYSKRNHHAQNVLEALAYRIIIPQKRFIVAEYESKIVGTLMGILDPHGFLYIADLLVDPEVRQQKIATSMFFKIINEWGIPNGVKTIWLQVEIENKEAMDLYTKLGFNKAYSYYYLEKSFEP
ncbi:MAG: GNAT family N-acetyltransferase [Candidatus Lokiarchaeota archaeon]|nr:GNAT family N-acetyltransferase [Candidatus Lokiarchaeota archaeon]